MAVVLGIIKIITEIAVFFGAGLSIVMVVAWIVRVVRYTDESRKK
ncbi:hypothetical protein AA700_1597 [Acidiphilium acidophilum DSM 700]|nr:hypothetical protein AA700_1597 [Acidiphilium acidophilum DSM 700]